MPMKAPAGGNTATTADAVIAHSLSGLGNRDAVTFAFQGGEPTLAGLGFFRRWTARVQESLVQRNDRPEVHYALQTNGILLDDEWCAFLAEHRFLVGLSLDGPAEFHDENRVDAAGRGTFAAVLRAKKCLEKHRVEYNVLCVLTNRAARFPRKIWNFLRAQGIRYVQFVPCLSPLEAAAGPQSLTPERFSSFYTQLLQLWGQDLKKGEYRSVKFFDDLFNLILKREATACGFTGCCRTQLVIEADGSAYPCDFFVLDRWKCGNLAVQTPEEILESEKAREFPLRCRPQSALCKTCRWNVICGGGCPRMRENMYVNREETFCGYRDFLDRNSAAVEELSEYLSRWNG